jgi:CelD/BcsL family acetyltransferase involved in cellulose biosynthesis
MQFSAVRTPNEFEALSGEWNALLTSSASHVPFLRYEYLAAWWKTLGGGEWPSGELWVITARSETGSLEAAAPLFFTTNREGIPALMFLGSIEISDYLDVLCPPEKLPEFLDGLLEFLFGSDAPGWQALDLYNLVDSSPTLPALEKVAARRSLRCTREQLQHCPSIPLPGDFETYLASLDKKQRHEVRRKMRRAEANDPPVEFQIVEDASHLDEEMEAFFGLMATDPEKAAFLTPAMREQMKLTARAAFANGWLQLVFAVVGEEKGAAYLNFDYQNRIWVYNSGLDPRFHGLSLGWVLLGYLIQWSIEHQRKVFDFMRGDEEYKYRFGGQDHRVERLIIQR